MIFALVDKLFLYSSLTSAEGDLQRKGISQHYPDTFVQKDI